MKDFENKLQQFEDISNKLSSEDISLNESLELFEKGNKIYFDLKKILDEAENKILTLEGNEFIENEDIKFE
ncbi:exodeoxyribonuclease VII small subunit [Citroniella saccharovorans]|uniref:Exodeoxyribonuclease 7 small subunit n=1 Tax=Citroniella saccharovorans TaxID=2053367 RepID=A0AAW9MPW6_9FIRM|nr:exodeoxyribonuclease VII small subunit [Citroniella saccharovorans]MEB3429593.1 exodeoxyribonuclease VII small subunit [Citroniella saccharovorans]